MNLATRNGRGDNDTSRKANPIWTFTTMAFQLFISPSAWRVSFTAYSELNLATKISTTRETFSFWVSNTFTPG